MKNYTQNYTPKQIKAIHLRRAEEFNNLLNDPFLRDTERNTIERLRDQRIKLANEVKL